MIRNVLVFLILCALPARSQHLALGIKGGVRLSSDVQGSAQSESQRYVVGPMAELGLPGGFAVEFDALYSRLGYSSTTGDPLGGVFTSRTRVNAWEFPLVAKFRLPAPVVRPYLLAGYAARRLSGEQAGSGYQVDLAGNRSPITSHYTPSYDATHGLVAGGGVEFGGRHVRIAPEVRYMRWNKDPVNEQGSRGYHVNLNLNELRFLVGVSGR